MHLTKRVLKKKAQPVDWKKPFENQKLAVQMIHFMQQQNGIGLAAPQIGISKRLFVMYTDKQYRYCFNPSIITVSNETSIIDEGCLSFKEIYYKIERPKIVNVLYYDYLGNKKTEVLDGISARCFLHELDHLDGIVFKQRLENKVPTKYNYASFKPRS